MCRESDLVDQLFAGSKLRSSRLNEGVYVNTHKVSDRYSYWLEMVPDPGTMFELTKHGETMGYIEVPNEKLKGGIYGDAFTATTGMGIGAGAGAVNATVGPYNFRMKSDDVIIHQADDYVHAYLDDGFTRFPETVDLFIPDDSEHMNNNHNSNERFSGTTKSYTVRRGKSLLYDAYKI